MYSKLAEHFVIVLDPIKILHLFLNPLKIVRCAKSYVD